MCVGEQGRKALSKRVEASERKAYVRRKPAKGHATEDTEADGAEEHKDKAAEHSAGTTTADGDLAVKRNSELPDADRFVGFARIFSGTLSTDPNRKRKQTLHVFGPKYNPNDPSSMVHVTTIRYCCVFVVWC